MVKIFNFWFILIFCMATAGFSQTANQTGKPINKFELRPSSRDYAPVRRGNANEKIQRSKLPTLRSSQADLKNKKLVKGNQKGKKRQGTANNIRRIRKANR